jgi:D-alanyl-D-alanine carboxypeptidase/D-alanyl-D-alanine-endopeptidase (penicillin-binding protein 4)
VKQTLASLGVDPNGFRQVDGSGLSRQNVATPQALIATLKAMMYAKGNDLFYRSLPVAGVNGTLRNRLRLPETQGRIRAKTGTLRGVRSLSGYLDHPYYGKILFSIMVNQPSQSGQVLVGAIDEIALRLAQLTPCQ